MLPRTPAVLQALLQLSDARVTCSKRLGELADVGFEADDRRGQLGDRAGATTWRGNERRRVTWWTPLSKYLWTILHFAY